MVLGMTLTVIQFKADIISASGEVGWVGEEDYHDGHEVLYLQHHVVISPIPFLSLPMIKEIKEG